MPFNIQKLVDEIQDIMTRYPVRLFGYIVLCAFFPCLICKVFGGSAWGPKVNIGITSFSWGAVPLFLALCWLAIIPIALQIKLENRRRKESEHLRMRELIESRKRSIRQREKIEKAESQATNF